MCRKLEEKQNRVSTHAHCLSGRAATLPISGRRRSAAETSAPLSAASDDDSGDPINPVGVKLKGAPRSLVIPSSCVTSSMPSVRGSIPSMPSGA